VTDVGVAGSRPSRGSAALVEALRDAIMTGAYSAGELVPSLRTIGEEHGVSQETVRRGLGTLVRQGLLTAEPRRGYRVVRSAKEAALQCPVAYVTSNRGKDPSGHDQVARLLGNAFQDAAAARDWSVLVAHVGGQSDETVAEKLRTAGTWGVALDTLDANVLATIMGLGLPVVMVNAWEETVRTDAVVQDNYLGGFLAAQHLVESGARRIAWIGPTGGHCHARQRYAGAVAGLKAAGRELDPDLCVDGGGIGFEAATRNLMKSGSRPDGVLALWTLPARAMAKVTRELGMAAEGNFRMVGWCVEELYESRYAALFDDGRVPAAITWKARTMVQRALVALAERRMQPGGDPVRVSVAVRLCPAKEGD
jgi:DNA-binding LacI/PurR family transcriptional regulator